MGADPVTVGLTLGGAAFSFYGQRQAAKAQERAERANAAYHAEQARHAEAQKRRSADIYLRQSTEFLGEQKSLIAKSGVDFTGSVLSKVISSTYAAEKEYLAILREGDMNVKLASMRADAARRNADFLGSSEYSTILTLGTLLNAGGDLAIAGARNKPASPAGTSPSGNTYTG